MGRQSTALRQAVRGVVATFICGHAAAGDERVIETIEVYGQAIESYLTEDMNTATRLGLSSLETPQSVSAITRTQLDDFQLDSLNDALKATTGIQVESVETDRTYYTARGFDITNFQIDGVGVPLTYGNLEGDIDTAIFERIEIVRGANGLMSGAGNPSATINMVRKRPTEDFRLSLSGTAGSWDTARVDGDISGGITDTTHGRLVLAREEKDSYLDRNALEKTVAYGVVDTELNPDTVLTVGASYQTSYSDGPLWGALPLIHTDGTPTDYDDSTSTSADWTYWDSIETHAFAELVHDLNSDWSARLYLSRNEIDGDSELFYMFGLPDPETGVGLTGYASEYDLEERRDLVDLYLTGTLNLFARDHDLVVGINWSEVQVDDISLFANDPALGFPAIGDFGQWDGNTPRPVFGSSPSGSDWTDEQLSLYAAARFHLTDALSLIGGARVVDWEGEGESYGESQNTEVSGKTIPYAGVVYRFGENYSAYASYTETFMPQADLGADLTRLDPAEGNNLEAGLKGYFFEGRLIASLAVFRTEHENISEYAYFDAASGKSIYQGRDYKSQGYELELAGELAPGLQASIGYTDLEIEDENGDDARSFVPKQVLRAYASYRPPMLEALKVGLGINWQDDIQRHYAGGFAVEQESYAVVDAFASYRVTEQLEISVNLHNIGDEQYLNSLYWDQAFYGAPLNGEVSVRWTY